VSFSQDWPEVRIRGGRLDGIEGIRSEPIFRGCLQSACRESEPLPAWRRRSLLFLECEEETLVSEI